MKEISLNRNQYLEAEKISLGAYYPLSGFMTEKEFYSVIENLILPDGSIFSIPIFLDISQEKAHTLLMTFGKHGFFVYIKHGLVYSGLSE